MGVGSGRLVELEAKGYDVVHLDGLTEEVSGGELGLLDGESCCVDEDGVTEFGADVAGFAGFEDIDDEADLAVGSVAGLPCSAVGMWQVDEARRQDGGLLCAEECLWRNEREHESCEQLAHGHMFS
jgi:hypothetical protein